MSWPPQPPAARESRLPSPKAAGLVPPVGSPGSKWHFPWALPCSAHPSFLDYFFVFYPPWSPEHLCTSLPPHTPYYLLGSALRIPFQLPSLNTLSAGCRQLLFPGVRDPPSLLPSHVRCRLWLSLLSFVSFRVEMGSTRVVSSPVFPFFKIKFTPQVFPFLQGSLFSVAFPSLLWFCLWMWPLEWVK